MSNHLTRVQMSNLLAGTEEDLGVEQHVRDCAICNAELSRFRDAMRQFRRTIVVYAKAADRTGPLSAETITTGSAASRFRAMRLSLAIAAIAMLLPIYVITNRQPYSTNALAPEAVISDESLLGGVESRLSRQVPRAFAPMMDLMTQEWNNQQSSRDQSEEGR